MLYKYTFTFTFTFAIVLPSSSQCVDVVQLVKRKADLETEMDSKLEDLRDSHEQERLRLASELDVKRQKLNDDHQQHVGVICYMFGITLNSEAFH